MDQERSVTELPVDDRFSYNQTGPAAQFTSDGRHLALSHQTPDRQISGVTTIDLGEDVLPVRRVIRSACRRRDVEDFAVRSLGSRMRPGRLGRLSPRQEVVFDVLVGFRR